MCRQQLIGCFLGDPVSAPRKHRRLYVVRDELHRHTDPLADGFLPTDRQDGHGQPSRHALLVLRDRGVERAVELEAATQASGSAASWSM